MNTEATALENMAVRDARDLPDLVGKLAAIDSPLAAQLAGKALVASRTPWGTLLVPVVAWLALRYGLGWTPELDTAVAGVLVLLCSYLMRLLTSAPITGLFHASAVSLAATPPVASVAAPTAASPIPFPTLGDKL